MQTAWFSDVCMLENRCLHGVCNACVWPHGVHAGPCTHCPQPHAGTMTNHRYCRGLRVRALLTRTRPTNMHNALEHSSSTRQRHAFSCRRRPRCRRRRIFHRWRGRRRVVGRRHIVRRLLRGRCGGGRHFNRGRRRHWGLVGRGHLCGGGGHRIHRQTFGGDVTAAWRARCKQRARSACIAGARPLEIGA